MRVGSERWWERVSPRVRDAIVRGRIGDVMASELTATEDMLRSEAASNYQPKDSRFDDIAAAGSDGLLDLNGGVISIRKVGVDTGDSVISRDAGDARYVAASTVSAFGASLIDDADAATCRTTLDVRYPHVYTVWAGPTVNWTVAASEALFLGSAPWSCQPYDGTRATQARITMCHVGAASSGSVKAYVKYTTNGQAAGTYNTVGTWASMAASGHVSITLGTGAGANYLDSGWVTLASGAKIDGMLAVTGDGGNGSTSITVYSMKVEIR